MTEQFQDPQKQGVYDAIFQRRDMRHFNSEPVSEAILQRLLKAAHAAPSVGFMQPWRIIRVQSNTRRQQLHDLAEAERQRTAAAMNDRREQFMSLKVQGILDCAEVWVVALMGERDRHIFGRRTLPQMDLASASCAIQNLWLAARAEGVGVGWVSLFEPGELAQLLQMPADAEPVAILCIGQVDGFYSEPMLLTEGWAQRGRLEDYVMVDGWDDVKEARAQQQWRDNDG